MTKNKTVPFVALLFALPVLCVPIAAAEYYVSNSGSDSHPGTAPATAWRSLAKVNGFQFVPGDVVRFERGGTWRGQLVPSSGSPQGHVTYTSYGEGPKPLLLGSIEKNKPDDWEPVESRLWRAGPFPCDVGNIVFNNGEKCGIKVVVAGFDPEVRGMGSMTIRPHVLVKDLSEEETDRFDAVAVPACVGSGRGQHTYRGWEDISSDRAAAIIRRVHAGGGIISTMCAGQCALKKAGLPRPKAGPDHPVAYDPDTRTATSVGPAVAVEAACLLLKQLIRDDEYRSFRRYNPWLFGGKDQFPPRVESLR